MARSGFEHGSRESAPAGSSAAAAQDLPFEGRSDPGQEQAATGAETIAGLR